MSAIVPGKVARVTVGGVQIYPPPPPPVTDGDQLLAAILAAPDDDAPRLAYADWLDENGQHERAEFVRVQCELAKDWPDLVIGGQHLETKGHVRRCRGCTLRGRERELFSALSGGFSTELAPFKFAAITVKDSLDGEPSYAVIRRGFVAEIRCTLAAFMAGPCQRCRSAGWDGAPDCPDCKGEGDVPGIAAELFARQPVERVTLVDREPWGPVPVARQFGWFDETANIIAGENDRSNLPSDVYLALRGGEPHPQGQRFGLYWPTADSANAALSAAAVRHGRQLAGLPV